MKTHSLNKDTADVSCFSEAIYSSSGCFFFSQADNRAKRITTDSSVFKTVSIIFSCHRIQRGKAALLSYLFFSVAREGEKKIQHREEQRTGEEK